MSSKEFKFTNRLSEAASPYLLQHAHNPVDWWEWCDEAFEKARREDKLVLISIGYSACHWCHVMESESFEQEDTAAIMNEHFVCIKVDREERPDIDQIYMDAVQLLTGRGGWPLNCFVLPDQRPIHGGTYFPKIEWEKLLKSLSEFYKNNKKEALQYATELTQGISKLNRFEVVQEGIGLNVESVLKEWSKSFDREYGGYNWAPKFPLPDNVDLFLRQWYHTKDNMFLDAVDTTLTKMAEGGIFDQVGGGFARYSTDLFWKVPHFEKMLYDNAQLMSLYSSAFQATQSYLYKKIVYKTHAFLKREMRSDEGLYYSAIDADSEGIEGKFYVWTKKELQQLLDTDEPVYSLYYSVDAYGNWEDGTNILYKSRRDNELEKLTGLSADEIERKIELCNEKLLNARSTRMAPGIDEKIITSWNALVISGYVQAYGAFGDRQFLDTAEVTMKVLLSHLQVNGQLHRIRKDGKILTPAFLEDYALLIEALLKLFEATSDMEYARLAKMFTQKAINQFYNADQKLFTFQSITGKQLVVNKIDVNDDVIPSSNAVMAHNLYTLAYLFEESTFEQMSRDMVRAVRAKIEKYPTGYSNWLKLIQRFDHGFCQMIVCVGKDVPDENTIIHQLLKPYHPDVIRLLKRKDRRDEVPLLADKVTEGKTKVYLCRDKTCNPPMDNIDEAFERLRYPL